MKKNVHLSQIKEEKEKKNAQKFNFLKCTYRLHKSRNIVAEEYWLVKFFPTDVKLKMKQIKDHQDVKECFYVKLIHQNTSNSHTHQY